MSRPSGWIIAGLVALGIITGIEWQGVMHPSVPPVLTSPVSLLTSVSERGHALPSASSPSPSPSKTTALSQPTSALTADSHPVESLAPTSQQMHDEAMKNPELPSRSMLIFSAEIENKLHKALEAETDSAQLLGEFDRCATQAGDMRISEAARAICLSGADRLAAKYPSLRARYENLEARTEPRILRLKKLSD